MHLLYSRFRPFFDGVSNANNGCCLSIHRQPHRCFGFILQLFRFGSQTIEQDLFPLHQAPVANQDSTAVYLCGNSMSGNAFKLLWFIQKQLALLRGANDGLTQGMF